MQAALHAADETVALLLSKGADPNATDSKGYSALIAATISGCESTVSLLDPVTTIAEEKALRSLAEHQLKLTPPVAELVRRAAERHTRRECGCSGIFFSRGCSAIRGLDYATAHGHSKMVKILTRGWQKGDLDPDGMDHGIANLLLKACSQLYCAPKLYLSGGSSLLEKASNTSREGCFELSK